MFGLVVRFDLKDGSGEVFDALTSEAVAVIREAEPGTLVYACHAVEGDAEARVFYELYRDKEAFEEHEHQEHVRRFHEKKAQYLSGEPRVEFLSLQLGKGTPAPDAHRP
jgi:quinol monooxygenase YgiN